MSFVRIRPVAVLMMIGVVGCSERDGVGDGGMSDGAADSGVADIGLPDAGLSDVSADTPPRTDATDATPDTRALDAPNDTRDASAVDSGSHDASPSDTSVPDIGVDASAIDSGVIDEGVTDTGVADTGVSSSTTLGTTMYLYVRHIAAAPGAGTNDVVYATGEFEGSIDVAGRTLTSAGARDVFVFAIDSAGTVLWARGFGTSADDYAKGITVSGTYVFLAMQGYGTVYLGAEAMLSLGSTGGSTGAIIRLSPSTGEGLVAINPPNLRFSGVAAASSDVVVCGEFDTGTTLAPLAPRTSSGFTDGFVAVLNSDLAAQSIRVFNSSSSDRADACAMNSDASIIYVAGEYGAPVDFGTGTSVFPGTPGGRTRAMFIASYQRDTTYRWHRTASFDFWSPGTHSVTALAITMGGVAIAGQSEGLDFGAFDLDGGLFVGKLAEADGALVFSASAPGIEMAPTTRVASSTTTGDIEVSGYLGGAIELGGPPAVGGGFVRSRFSADGTHIDSANIGRGMETGGVLRLGTTTVVAGTTFAGSSVIGVPAVSAPTGFVVRYR